MSRSTSTANDFKKNKSGKDNGRLFGGIRPTDEVDQILFDFDDLLKGFGAGREKHSLFQQQIQLRAKELSKLEVEKRTEYKKLLQNEMSLFQTLNAYLIKPLPNPPTNFNFDDYAQYNSAREALQESVANAGLELMELAKQILKSPPKSIKKEIQLLNTVSNDIKSYYQFTTDEQHLANLLHSCKVLQSKLGSSWGKVKAAVAMVVGAACIVAGILGIVPSFGASVALIGLGAMICSASGLSTLKVFTPKKTLAANEAAQHIKEMMIEGNKLLKLHKNAKLFYPEHKEEPREVAKQDQPSRRRV